LGEKGLIVTCCSHPEPISNEHDLAGFDSGEPSLNEWLKKRAYKNQLTGVSRCFVICENNAVIGYYSLSAGAIAREQAPKTNRRNMPNPLPILLLGRLAIDKKYHNCPFVSGFLRDALLRSTRLSSDAGIFAVLVHAISEPAKRFYLSRGFVESPIKPMTLMMTMKTVRTILAE